MNKSDLPRNACLLRGAMAKRGYVRWWHSFTGIQPETGEKKVFFVEYFIINPALGGDLPILGQHPYYKKRGIRPSYVMIKAGVFGDEDSGSAKQLHSFYPISALQSATEPFVLQVEDNFYSENHIFGTVDVTAEEARHRSFMCDEGHMEWDLEVHKEIACHTGKIANAFFCALNALETFWHAEGAKTIYRGTVTLDGVLYDVSPENCSGYADKHWGRSFNTPWLQLASGSLASERTGRKLKHAALTVDGCCPRFLWFPLRRRLLLQLHYGGEDFNFHLSRFRDGCRTKWKVRQTNELVIWRIVAQSKSAVIKINASCPKADMLSLRYEDPDGRRTPAPLLGGGTGTGTILLYRRIPGGKQLLDTLSMENIFCEYSPDPAEKKKSKRRRNQY